VQKKQCNRANWQASAAAPGDVAKHRLRVEILFHTTAPSPTGRTEQQVM